MPKLVQLYLEAKGGNGKPLMLDGLNYYSLIKQASNKLKCKIKSIFLPDGTLITPENIDNFLRHGSSVVCSTKEFANVPSRPQNYSSSSSSSQQQLLSTQEIEERVIFLNKSSEVEEEAIKQVYSTVQRFPSIVRAVALPDLCPGKSFPIGATFETQGEILPFLVGNDVGCGMTLFNTNLKEPTFKKAGQWAESLQEMDKYQQFNQASQLIKKYNISPTPFDAEQLGTVGGGNHFAELQVVEEILDEKIFEQMQLQLNKLYLLVHSGSRGYGASILKDHLDSHGTAGIDAESRDAIEYLRKHDNAVEWAKLNRKIIALRILTQIGCNVDIDYLDTQKQIKNIAKNVDNTNSQDDDQTKKQSDFNDSENNSGNLQFRNYQKIKQIDGYSLNNNDTINENNIDTIINSEIRSDKTSNQVDKQFQQNYENENNNTKIFSLSDNHSLNNDIYINNVININGTSNNSKMNPIFDITHNSVEKIGDNQWVHRKGAAPTNFGPLMIPGSRGSYSYLVYPTNNIDLQKRACFSVAHGAGRKWSRTKSLEMGKAKFPNAKDLSTTPLQSHVVCGDQQQQRPLNPCMFATLTKDGV
eukprot:TRINITY_DN7425_c0_g1_i3.p1 TRINITY_DN7425_c0_g1~~TRINITY_DN7425_c0_g1_i3.p1  ORF type:complete len:586 (-),score=86.63 TRINITY_DN7425_c0_g1_i3:18-1775(-)